MTAARSAPAPKILRFPVAKQRRMDALLEKNSEGTLSDRERVALQRLVAEAEQLMITNAQRLAAFSKLTNAGALTNAVPVTVWVSAATSESSTK